jgi:DNA-binding transcriptional LysR family regulator
VLKPKGCGTRETLRLLMAKEGLAHEIVAEVRDEHLQLSLIAGGLGVGLVASRSLARHPRLRELRALRVPGLAPSLDIVAVRGVHLGCLAAAVDALEEALAERFADAEGAR